MTKIYRLYLELLEKYGQPRSWPWTRFASPRREAGREARQEDGVDPSTPFEICLGAILTQNTNWQNVEMALENLRKAKAITVVKLATIADEELEKHLRPSGFYRQKTQRVKNLCRHIVKNYCGKLEKLWENKLSKLRQELLSLSGIGPETADTMLLYGGKKLIFVIDEYTRRFAKRHNLAKDFSYEGLQKIFMNNLPKSVKIYEDYHALIVEEGKSSRKLNYAENNFL